MLDRMKAEVGTVEMSASTGNELSHLERRLIGIYRQLNKQEQDRLHRLTEMLITYPEHSEDD